MTSASFCRKRSLGTTGKKLHDTNTMLLATTVTGTSQTTATTPAIPTAITAKQQEQQQHHHQQQQEQQQEQQHDNTMEAVETGNVFFQLDDSFNCGCPPDTVSLTTCLPDSLSYSSSSSSSGSLGEQHNGKRFHGQHPAFYQHHSHQDLPMDVWAMRRQQLFQISVVVILFCMMLSTNQRVHEASLRLELYQDEDDLLIRRMSEIEEEARELGDKLRRLREDQYNLLEPSMKLQDISRDKAAVQKEVYQWKAQADEMDREVSDLERFLQMGARQQLQDRYGTGALRVSMNLDFQDENPGQLVMEMFEDTPHAAWVWLQQINNGDWSDVEFMWHPSHILATGASQAKAANLEFSEQTVANHQAWTVGLTSPEEGEYHLYINLKDNANMQEDDACLGTIVAGFDALQRLMRVKTVKQHPNDQDSMMKPPVKITSFDVSTVDRVRARSRNEFR